MSLIWIHRLSNTNNVKLTKVIGTDAATLSYYALDVAPAAALEEGASADRILESIQFRLAKYLPEFKPSRRRQKDGKLT